MSVWNNLYNIGIKPHDTIQLIRKKKMNNVVTFFTTIATAFFIPYLLICNNNYYVVFDLIATLLIFFAFVFNYFGWLNLSMFWRFVVVIANVTYASLEMPGSGFQYFLIPLGLIPFILSDDTKKQLVLMFAAIAFFFFQMHYSQQYVPNSSALSNQQKIITYSIVLTMVFVLCALFVIKFKLAGTKFENVIRNQLKEIEEQKKDILDSINYAKRIQSALLPPSEQFQESLNDYFVYYQPKDIVSGDFYWLEKHQNKVYVAVADCTGHGVPGAMMSVLCNNALTKVLKELDIESPSLILDKVADLMEVQLSKTSTDMMDGMDITLCCIDFNNRTLEYAGANNNLFMISNNSLKEIIADKQSIGKVENRKAYTNHTLQISNGDCFYLFSDGLQDQFGGDRGKKYSKKKLKETLLANCSLPMVEQYKVLNSSFNQWKGELSQVDDVCVLGFRV